MCCRYYYEDFEIELRELMKAEAVVKLSDFDRSKTTNRDIYPSQASVTIHSAESNGGHKTDTLGVSEMFWGFENPYRKGLIINARSETAREKNLFAESIARRRCVIPASGFYEWDPYKARFRFSHPDDELLLLAGIYHEEHGAPAPHYTILTTQANESMIPVHDRMPVIISRDEIHPWLNDNEKLSDFLERPQLQLVCEQDSGQIRMDFGL